MQVRIYGLKNCDTCRKAVKELMKFIMDMNFIKILERRIVRFMVL